ncbi:hypothetical protein COP1_012679 [Malus domestica]
MTNMVDTCWSSVIPFFSYRWLLLTASTVDRSSTAAAFTLYLPSSYSIHYCFDSYVVLSTKKPEPCFSNSLLQREPPPPSDMPAEPVEGEFKLELCPSQQKIFMEYIMFDGVTDEEQHAHLLGKNSGDC